MRERNHIRSTLSPTSNFNSLLGTSVAVFRSVDHYVRERVRAFLARRHKVAGRGNRRFTWDAIHRNHGVMSGSMSGDGKRSVGHRPQATAPILDSARTAVVGVAIQTAHHRCGRKRRASRFTFIPALVAGSNAALSPQAGARTAS